MGPKSCGVVRWGLDTLCQTSPIPRSPDGDKNNLFTSNSICRTQTFQMFIVHDLDDEITRIQTRRNKANETRNGFENESEIGLFSSF